MDLKGLLSVIFILMQMASHKSDESDDSCSDEDERPNATGMLGVDEELEGSATKYLQDEAGGDRDIASETLVPEDGLQASSVATSVATEATKKKKSKYIEVDPKMLGNEEPQSQSEQSDKLALEEDKTSVNYARLKPIPKVKLAAVGKPTKAKSEVSRTGRGE